MGKSDGNGLSLTNLHDHFGASLIPNLLEFLEYLAERRFHRVDYAVTKERFLDGGFEHTDTRQISGYEGGVSVFSAPIIYVSMAPLRHGLAIRDEKIDLA